MHTHDSKYRSSQLNPILKLIIMFVGAMLMCGVWATAAHAATITVTSDAGGSSSTACTLYDAVEAADNDMTVGGCSAGNDADSITFATPITISLTAPLNIASNITIDGDGMVVLDSGNTTRHLVVQAAGHVILDGLTLQGGFDAGNGGAINNLGTLNIVNSTIKNSRANSQGGGILNDGGLLTITDSTISGNTAILGGGILNRNSGTLTVTNSTISGNTATSNGGGIYNWESAATIDGSDIRDNATSNNHGGGIFNRTGGRVTVTNSTIRGNTATAIGGGIYNWGASTITIDSTIISDNVATNNHAGGVYNRDMGSVVMVINSTIVNNTAAVFGGGFMQALESPTTTIISSTISGNTAGTREGAIRSTDGTFELFDSIIADNPDPFHSQCLGVTAGTDTISTDDSCGNATVDTVNITAFPSNNELYPRDVSTNLADVIISGQANRTTTSLTLRVYRAAALWLETEITPDQNLDVNYTVRLPAELAAYRFELMVNSVGGTQTTIAAADNVVAGDLYVINGQSNAAAVQIDGSGAGDTNRFIRTYGWWGGDVWRVDTDWYEAVPDCVGSAGCVGQWGLRFGHNIVTEEQIPVAIINGARGGQAIAYFQRDNSDPMNVETNFGRLFTRLTQANRQNNIRAIFWYQGESDGLDYQGHIDGFTELFADWESTYSSVERYYIFQVRNGCGAREETSNVQRLFADERAHVTAVATTALNAHDGCHYAYVDGYQKMGDDLSALVRRDLYEQPLLGVGSAAPTTATLIDDNTIDASFDTDSSLIADDGFEALFQLVDESTGAIYTFSAGEVLNDTTVRLTTNQPIAN